MDYTILREKMKKKLKEKGWSIKQVEEKAGVSSTALRYFLSGRTKNPRLETLKDFSKFFEIDLSDFTDDSSTTPLKLSDNLFDINLFLKVADSLKKFIEGHKIEVSAPVVLSTFQELYAFCQNKGIQDIDENVAEAFFSKAFL